MARNNRPENSEKQMKEWETVYRKSKQAIPFYAVTTVLAVVFVWKVKPNAWQSAIILLLSAGYLIANILTLIRSAKHLQRLTANETRRSS